MTLNEHFETMKPIWRIPLMLIAFQLAGGVIALSKSYYGDPVIDFWYGAATSTFPGFIIGTLWHNFASTDKLQDHKPPFIFIAVISLLLTLSTFFIPLDLIASQAN